MPNPANDNPSVLYTMDEAAAYCGRSKAIFRKHYLNDNLPDPVNTQVFPSGKKVRMYTLAECKQLKNFFDSQRPGRKKRKRRSQ